MLSGPISIAERALTILARHGRWFSFRHVDTGEYDTETATGADTVTLTPFFAAKLRGGTFQATGGLIEVRRERLVIPIAQPDGIELQRPDTGDQVVDGEDPERPERTYEIGRIDAIEAEGREAVLIMELA